MREGPDSHPGRLWALAARSLPGCFRWSMLYSELHPSAPSLPPHG